MHVKSSIRVGRVGDDEGVVVGEVGGLHGEQGAGEDKQVLLLEVGEEGHHSHLVQNQAIRVLHKYIHT